MPPKVKITKNDIISTALELVRTSGEQTLNARAIATALDCSTQPVFSNFSSMQTLREAVIAAAYERYLGFIGSEAESGKYPKYKAFGRAYVRFAEEERELFKLLFMRDRTGEDLSPSPDFEASAQMIAEANGVSIEIARLIHLEAWSCVHGIGVMIATSFLHLDRDLIGRMLSDVYKGVRSQHRSEDK